MSVASKGEKEAETLALSPAGSSVEDVKAIIAPPARTHPCEINGEIISHPGCLAV